MRTPLKLAAFAAAIALVFGGALGVGAAVGGPAPAATTEHDGIGGTPHGADAGSLTNRPPITRGGSP